VQAPVQAPVRQTRRLPGGALAQPTALPPVGRCWWRCLPRARRPAQPLALVLALVLVLAAHA
jgi:hypothetical protein